MKIIYGMLGHEANTFSTEEGSFERFAPLGWAVGDEIYDKFKDSSDYPTGMIQAAEKYGVELLPTVALQNSAPLLTKACLDKTVGALMDGVEKYADECDGVCLTLHGAGVAEGVDDLEIYILEKVRAAVGDKPITVCLDLHGNISQGMVDLSNGLFGIKEYPHIDALQAGYLAMETVIKLVNKEIKIETAVERTNMLVPCPVGVTTRMPMQWFRDLVADYAEKNKLYDATFFHGFPYANVPCCSATVVTVADENSLVSAKQAAKELTAEIWEHRNMLDIIYPQPPEAIDEAVEMRSQYEDGYVLINETSDNAGGGCPGDGTYLVRALIEKNLPRSIFGYIYDNKAALMAHEAGVGAVLKDILLGGHTDDRHGEPVYIKEAKVLKLADVHQIYKTPVVIGLPVYYGKSALLEIGNVHVIVSEIMPEQTFDDCPFTQLDIELDDHDYDIVCIKSTNHFRAFFDDKVLGIVTTDPPGIQTANLRQLDFDKVIHPIWPLDIK